jgi:uncharacterized protein (TIGR03382 family)
VEFMTRCRPVLVAVFAFAVVIAMPAAQAHFKLDSPPAYSTQGSLGDPQKAPPCGPSGSFTPTNAVTSVKTGSTITIQISETIFHPGHYRVALAQDEASLPADPAVTPSGSDPCAEAAIDPNPTMPILADGLLVHTSQFGGPQTMQVTLPAGFTCTNCLLQVIQTMSKHPAPCFYHHCATLTIADDAPPPPDGGVIPGDDAGTGGGGNEATGGCCDAGGSSPATGFVGALLVGLLVLRRRR